MVGDYAVMLYAEPRYTNDIDLVIGTRPREVDRFAAALSEFGLPMTPEQMLEFSQPNKMISLGVPPNRIDLPNQIDGVDFDAAWERRNTVEIQGQTISVISREHLIATKRALAPRHRLYSQAWSPASPPSSSA